VCGIFGSWHFDGQQVSREVLQRMGHRMLHRGPDDEGYLIHGSMGMGMRRLSVIDLAGGRQPIGSEDGMVHVVLNGEIFNYLDLRAQLVSRGHHFSTRSDTEVLVHLYEELGRECVHELNGMFAFAIYDARKRSLWIARDRLGIKPLFFHQSAAALHFSSDLNAINEVVRAPLSATALTAYLGYSYVPGPHSIYEGIQKLLPAEELVIEDHRVSRRRYWSLPRKVVQRPVKALVEELDALLEAAVRLQLQSDVPVGILLSGGVDSSAVAAYGASQLAEGALRSFTVDFEGKGGSDARHAEELSRKFHTRHTNISIRFQNQSVLLDRLLMSMDEPMGDNAIVPTFALASEAAAQGVKVLLSGAGGDEIFGGYDRHVPAIPGTAAWFAQLPPVLRAALKPAWRVWNPALGMRLHNPARNFFISTSGTDLHLLQSLLRDRSQFEALLDSFDAHLASFHARDAYSRMQLDLNHYLPDNILALTDKATMAASVEGRVPLLDHRLVELAFSMPESVNLPGGKKKGLFRRVLASRLPAYILDRPKEGFNAPTGAWIGQWTPIIRAELTLRPARALKELLNLDVLGIWLDDPARCARGAELLYSLYVLNRWLVVHEH
jgi:asparagine synthase (glutamine-hydrolysing)